MATVRWRWPLKKVLRSLAARYGPPRALPARGAFELILWENVAYLADDDRRARAFRELQARVGTKPEAILRAPEEVLREVAGAGIMADQQVGKLRLSAEIALQKFGGDLGPALADLPSKEGAVPLSRNRGAGRREDPAPHA